MCIKYAHDKYMYKYAQLYWPLHFTLKHTPQDFWAVKMFNLFCNLFVPACEIQQLYIKQVISDVNNSVILGGKKLKQDFFFLK